eukprot:m.93330 g.93330  ORF g.93330 m.93330 type:complete len:108 (+) comp13399_c0_seq1:1252-1575(+)
MGEFTKAINVWQERGPTENNEENAWLYHDLGRCFCEIGDYEQALDYGLLALDASRKSGHLRWTLYACLLIGQCKVQNRDYDGASGMYKEALECAKVSPVRSYLCFFP